MTKRELVRYGFVGMTLAGAILATASEKTSEVFVGTEGMGNTSPAAMVPFGMVQAGPDTSREASRYEFGKAHCGGYQHSDRYLWRFSQTHVSGMGVPAGGNVAILPQLAGETGESAEMNKETEIGVPGYYAVELKNGIGCEVTATERTAVYRFTYPENAEAELLFDADWALMPPRGGDDGTFTRTIRAGICRFDSQTVLRGYQDLRCYVDYTVNFVAEFSQPALTRQKVRESDGRRGDVWRLGFGKLPDGILEVRIALSFASQDGARKNLKAERDAFFSVRAAAKEKWKAWFDRLQVDKEQKAAANLRAAMYHLATQPNLASDVGGKERYVNFSLWDTFRAAHPLYTLLAPERVDAFVNSLLDEGDDRGYLPILSLYGRDTHCMVGHHSAPVIADAWLKGFRGFDAKRALAAMNRSYRVEHVPESTACWGFMKEDWRILDRYGYYPFDLLRTSFKGRLLQGESVSRLLECAYDDSCVARFAAAVGADRDAAFFAKRAGYWRNVFDTSVGYVRGKDSAGRWREPFNPATIGYGPFADNDFTEGNSYQYSWHVMQDPEGLVAALGGKKAAGEKLDALFATAAGTGENDRSYDVTGLIGQYAHGNEVSHHIAYFYAYTDRPWRTADIVRKVFETQYAPRPDGLCGNDDCGQMSAWYVFSALGFYPLDPCGGRYVLGAPQVPLACLQLAGGKWLTVQADGFSENRPHVKGASLELESGTSELSLTVDHRDLVEGGTLHFEMRE